MRPALPYEMFRAARAPAPGSTDAAAVGRLADGYEALDELIRRHGPWLLGLCRRLAPDRNAAEDVFQASVLVLVRRAGALRGYPSVAGFLHGVAVKVAARARATARRTAPGAERGRLPDPVDEAAAREEAHILHQELGRLPGKYREPILLCDLAGLTREAAAVRLGCSEGAVKWRLERGRAALRVRLMRRGVVASGVLGATAAVPPALAATVARAASGSVAASVTELMTAAAEPVIGAKVLIPLALTVAAGLGFGFAPPAVRSAFAAPPRAPRPVLAAAPVPPPDNRPAEDALAKALAVLDKLEGQPGTRTRLACAVADLQRKLGKPDDARATLKGAKAIAEVLGDGQYGEWREIGPCYARLGDAKTVLDLAASVPAESIRDGHPRETILQESAFAAAEVGNARAAEQIAGALPDKWDGVRHGVRQRLLVHQAKSGDVAGAVRAAEKLQTPAGRVWALAGVETFDLGYDDANWFLSGDEGIGVVQLAAGDRAGAKDTALRALARLPDIPADERGAPAAAVAKLLAKLDAVGEARKALGHVPLKPKRRADLGPGGQNQWALKVTACVAAAEARAGRDDAARALALDFTEPGWRAYVFQTIGVAQGRAGRNDDAKAAFARAAELIEKAPGAGTGWHNLASAQSLAGDHDGAARSVERQPDSGRGALWMNVACGRAQNGDLAAVRKILADKIGNQMWRELAAQIVAQKLARAGRAEAVREWAANEESDLTRAHILVGLAEGLYRELPRPPQR